jgi:hypothetical protein
MLENIAHLQASPLPPESVLDHTPLLCLLVRFYQEVLRRTDDAHLF